MQGANTRGAFFVAQEVAKRMIMRSAGVAQKPAYRIINIASVAGLRVLPQIGLYSMSKAAVVHMTKAMALEWGRHGINVNAIAPGYFDTPLNAALVADPDFSEWLAKRTPAGRWGNVEELVGACVFLSSGASSFVNGHTLYVDGGITASL